MKLTLALMPMAFAAFPECHKSLTDNVDNDCFSDSCIQQRIGDFQACMGVQEEYPVLTPICKPGDMLPQFLSAIYECTKIQANHPLCVETDPSFNPIMCAVLINKCLAEELEGILDCRNPSNKIRLH